MAIPKKGSRLIVADGVQYRWRVRGRYTYQQLLGSYWYLAVEHADTKSGQVMVIRLPQGHPN